MLPTRIRDNNMIELRVYREKRNLRRGEEQYYYKIINDNLFEDKDEFYEKRYKCTANEYWNSSNLATKTPNSQIAILEYKVCNMTDELLNRFQDIQIYTKKEEFEEKLQKQLSIIENEFTDLKNYLLLRKYIGKNVCKFNVESGEHYDFNYSLYSDTKTPDVSQLSNYDTVNMIDYEIVPFEVNFIQDNCHYFDGIFIDNLREIF